MQPPPPVVGLRWRAGRRQDADAVAAIGAAAADRTDEAGHLRTRSDVVQLLAMIDPDRALLVGEREGRPVAFGAAWRPRGGPVRLLGAVLPEARGAGVGRALLAAQIDHARSAEPDAPAMTVRAMGDGGVAPLARRAGFSPARVFSNLQRDLAEPVDAIALPAGLRLEPLRPELDERLRLAKNAIFRDHWQALPEAAAEWRAGPVGPRLVRERSRAAVDERGHVAGFVLVHRIEERPQRASIPLVGTVRPHRGRGLARALLASALRASAEAGLVDAELDVDVDSPTGAGRVYAAVGFQEIARATVWSRPLVP